MLEIYSLIWTICDKLIWYCRNAVLFHIIFIVMLGEIFGHLGHTVTLTVNKMALPSIYRRRWCHFLAFFETNMIALGVQRFTAGAKVICLTYTRDWWGVIGPVIHGEPSQNLGPLGAAQTMWVYYTLSTIDTQESKLRLCLVLPNW